MHVLKPETPVEGITMAPSQCRGCPTSTRIAEGFQSLRKMDVPITPPDVADLAAVACGSCAGRYPRVLFTPDSVRHTGEIVTRVWLTLRPAGNDDMPVLFPLAAPQPQEPST